jgi:AcrR family transcriptional regulator
MKMSEIIYREEEARVATTEADQVDRRGRRKEAKLAVILAEAWALAHRDGLAAISLRDLADRVDLRQPSLYAYFDSKLGLYDLMFADGNRQLLERVRSHSVERRPPPGARRVRAGTGAVLE